MNLAGWLVRAVLLACVGFVSAAMVVEYGTSGVQAQRRVRRGAVKRQVTKDVPPPAAAPAAPPAALESLAKRQWMPAILSREQFDVMARTFNPDLLHPLPEVLFVIDRQQANRIYYVNMRYFTLHEAFVNSQYLSLERGRTFWENNHLKDNRRFLLGRVVWQSAIRRFCFEFWEGDTISSEQLALAAAVINKSFFRPVAFKPNSPVQAQAAANAVGVERAVVADLAREVIYQPLNVSRGIGRLRIVRRFDERTTLGTEDIVVLNETPLSLPPIAGIIMARMSSPLSHVNLLARSWGIPNAYIRDADAQLAALNGKWVIYETTSRGYEIKPASDAALAAHRRDVAARRRTMTPRYDLSIRDIAALHEQNIAVAAAYGAKSSNLGELVSARIGGVAVPDGWTVPVFYYDQFLRENRVYPFIRTMLADERFRRDAMYRRDRLALIRSLMQRGAINPELRRLALARFHANGGSGGVFVRSSSNAEDLPNFNGAGLYDTVPNVRDEKALLEAIKHVWASLWNFEAFESRERAGIDHTKAMMAVLVQNGINAEAAGVMITTDPFNDFNREAIYINAKRGLGIRVVEGKRIAEQILFDPRSNQLDVLTRSAEDSLLEFDDGGGIREVPITGSRIVLTDDIVRRLSRAALAIKRHFKGAEQDIEWVLMRDEIYIVQSRPFIE